MSREVDLVPARRAQLQPRLAELANRQHGVVGWRQLRELGFSSSAIDRMLARDQLHLLHRGVYAVGHLNLSRSARFLAACLATGGVLSHRSAGALHHLLSYDGRVEVTVPTKGRRQPDLLLHCSVLPPDETSEIDGIPVTTTPRTLLDLASVLDEHRLGRAVGQPERLRLTNEYSVPALLARHPGRRGSRALRELVEEPPPVLASELEYRYRSLTEQFGLSCGTPNTTRSGHEVDVVYVRQRLIVELDGRSVHQTRRAFEADRERDRRLAVQGWRVIRLTWRQLHRDGPEIARDLRVILLT